MIMMNNSILQGCQSSALKEPIENKIKVCQNGIERSNMSKKERHGRGKKIKTKFKNTVYKQLNGDGHAKRN